MNKYKVRKYLYIDRTLYIDRDQFRWGVRVSCPNRSTPALAPKWPLKIPPVLTLKQTQLDPRGRVSFKKNRKPCTTDLLHVTMVFNEVTMKRFNIALVRDASLSRGVRASPSGQLTPLTKKVESSVWVIARHFDSKPESKEL